MARARRHGGRLGLLFLDLDHFQGVNEGLGRAAGDQLLDAVEHRLRQRVRKEDSFMRLNGDEFVLILETLQEGQEAARVARELLGCLDAVFAVAGGHEVYQSASIGISLYPDDCEQPDDLVRHAEAAMREAKQLGRGQFCFHTADMNVDALARLELENALRHALARDELELYFQPKVDLHNGHSLAAEALLRWNRDGRVIQPGHFIPLAERTGLVVPIGTWVIQRACACLAAWHEQGLCDIRLAVNVSARQFRQGDLARVVAEALELHGVEPCRLELELTESMLMDDPEATRTLLQRLKDIGVSLSLDDFGTGYSCFAYLSRFPLDTLKVDQSFVRDMVSDANTAGIVASIIALAHKLKLAVVAEGVETAAQLAYLHRLGCDEIQGYHYSRPLPEADYLALLAEARTLPVAAVGATSPTLLLVDDEPGILAALRRMLRTEGYRILTAENAADGLEKLALEEVQVVISDQRMPHMSGSEFLTKVKDMHPDCVRIILSGQADMAAVLDAINDGAVYKFLTKPWDDAQLRERIREAFRVQAALATSYQP